jgi:hypothetical protein
MADGANLAQEDDLVFDASDDPVHNFLSHEQSACDRHGGR